MPSPACCQGLMGRRYRDVPSGCLPASSYRQNPTAAGSGAVVTQLGERAKLLAFLNDDCTCCRVDNVGQRFTVALHRHFFRSRFVWCGVVPVMLSTCSGFAPPCSAYILRMRRKIPARISPSVTAIPGASAPFQCHCNQRPELTIEPFSSAKQVDGRRNTSVWIFDGSTSFDSPWFCQKVDVSVLSGSMVTRISVWTVKPRPCFYSGMTRPG